MEKQSHTSMPSRRWWRSRNGAYLGVLIVLLAAGYWFHDWFFMPEDLRRMQGDWVIVKVTNGRGEIEAEEIQAKILSFKGRSFVQPDNEPAPFEVNDGIFYLCDPENTHTLFGFRFRLPLWLSRAKGVAFGTYEFKDGQLVLALIGEVDESKNRKELSAEAQEIIYLERHDQQLQELQK